MSILVSYFAQEITTRIHIQVAFISTHEHRERGMISSISKDVTSLLNPDLFSLARIIFRCVVALRIEVSTHLPSSTAQQPLPMLASEQTAPHRGNQVSPCENAARISLCVRESLLRGGLSTYSWRPLTKFWCKGTPFLGLGGCVVL